MFTPDTPAARADLDADNEAPLLHVLILHDDQAAYMRALRMLVNTFRDEPESSRLRPLPWQFDELETDQLRALAANDFVRADVFVISSSQRRVLPERVSGWLRTAFEARRERPTAVIAMGDRWDEEDGELVQAVRELARGAGLDFIESGKLAVAEC